MIYNDYFCVGVCLFVVLPGLFYDKGCVLLVGCIVLECRICGLCLFGFAFLICVCCDCLMRLVSGFV